MAFEALNEKFKNLGKKNADSEKKRNNNMGDFFRKNAFLKYLIPVAIFLVAIGVFLYVVIDDTVREEETKIASDVMGQTDQSVVVLPNGANEIGTTDPDLAALIQRDPLSEDILAKAKYVGYVFYSASYRVGVVTNGGISYELTVGDCLGESSWQVTEISTDSITFSSGKTTKTLSYAG